VALGQILRQAKPARNLQGSASYSVSSAKQRCIVVLQILVHWALLVNTNSTDSGPWAGDGGSIALKPSNA
jgi:hypothetical protein